MQYFQEKHRKPEKPPTELVPSAYLKRLKENVARVELLGLDLKESITNGLPQVYVPAMTNRAAEKTEPEERFEQDQREFILHRLGEESLYVPGDPGSVKSTFTQWVTYLVAHGSVPANEITAPDDLQEQLPDSLLGRLPVLIRLRDFWSFIGRRSDQGDWTQNELELAITRWLDMTRPFGLDSATFKMILAENNLILIFDGIDEVPEEYLDNEQILCPRHALITGLSDALGQWQACGHRILVTRRRYGLTPVERDRLNLPEAALLPLHHDQQQLFIARWYATADHANREDFTMGLTEEHQNRDELNQLRSNPLLLTALCVKYKEGKRLPHDIYHLYNSVVDQVLYNRFRSSDLERTRVRWRLEAVALGIHYGMEDSVRQTPLASVSLDELDRILANYAEQNPSTEGGAEKVLATRNEMLERSGLLLPRGEGRLRRTGYGW